MKVAVIGVGHWGIKHVDEYIQLGYNVTICDKSKENINNYITILGFRTCYVETKYFISFN